MSTDLTETHACRLLAHRTFWFSGLLLATALVTGCGPSKPELVPVSGVVKVDGKPLTTGSIQFIPKDQRPAYGQIGPNGEFVLETDSEKGCVKGKHQVVVTAQEIIGTPETGESMKYLAPERYGSVDTTDISVEIDGPKSDLEINLMSS